jgi:hypothetical protein
MIRRLWGCLLLPLCFLGTACSAQTTLPESVQWETAWRTVYSQTPITVECWVKLLSKTGFNVFVANEPKESGTHWEVYSYVQSGVLSVFLPGYAPSGILSKHDITDGRWHYVAMRFDGRTAELYLDGRQVVRQAVTRRPRMPTRTGPLSFGAALWDGGEIGCDGFVDDVRISDALRPIAGVPQTALTADEHTVGLWSPVSLDGPWQLVEGGAAETRLRGDWSRPIAAVVPGSVHTALVRAGVIPHPFVGRNQELARPWSFKTYWYKTTFPRPPQGQDRTLVFHER